MADERRRCKARSSRTGQQCRAYAITGGTVCVAHGGRAPQVKRKALERIREARDMALEKFIEQLGEDVVNPSTTLAAARDLTSVVASLEDRESGAMQPSVVDEWLRSLKDGR